jgi:hypothetical protein
MNYCTYAAALMLGFASIAGSAAEPSAKSQQSTPEAARGGEPTGAKNAGTTGGQQSDANAVGAEGKRKTGQASSAEQTDAQGSQQGASNSDSSPEASRKTGQAASASDSNASSTQEQGSQSQANSGDSTTQQNNNAVGTNGPTNDPATQKQNSPREDPAYSADASKCDSMQGDEKQKCLASAKRKAKDM